MCLCLDVGTSSIASDCSDARTTGNQGLGLLHYVVKVPVVVGTAETIVQYMASFLKGAL